MNIRASLSQLTANLQGLIGQFEDLQDTKIQSEEQLKHAVNELRGLKKEAANYLKSNAPTEVANDLAYYIEDENRYSIPGTRQQGLNQRLINDFQSRVKERIAAIGLVLEYLRVSDPLSQGRSLTFERANMTIKEKSEFILLKLYHLRKHSILWDVRWLFALNDVAMDADDEAWQIIGTLSSHDYVEKLDALGGYVNVKIKIAGKDYVETHLLDKQSATEENHTIDIECSEADEKASSEELMSILVSVMSERLDDIDEKIDRIIADFEKEKADKSKSEFRSWFKNKMRDEIFKGVVNPATAQRLINLIEGGSRLIG